MGRVIIVHVWPKCYVRNVFRVRRPQGLRYNTNDYALNIARPPLCLKTDLSHNRLGAAIARGCPIARGYPIAVAP